MLRRRALLASAAALAAPALIPRASLGQALRKVKLGSAFTTTTNAMFLMPDLLRPEGIDAEIITFPSLVQRMQAVASGSVDVGNGGLSATMQVATKGFPMSVLANGCDGGWMMLARPGITGFQQLRGKKIGVQNGSIALVSLHWKLRHEGIADQVELLFLDNQDQPVPLARGSVDAICCFEPYATFAELNGFGQKLWVPYDTPMGKTNLGFVASAGLAHNPASNLKLKSWVAPMRRVIDAGVNVALGCDNCSCGDCQSMFTAMKLLCLLAAAVDPNLTGGDPRGDGWRCASPGPGRRGRRHRAGDAGRLGNTGPAGHRLRAAQQRRPPDGVRRVRARRAQRGGGRQAGAGRRPDHHG